MMNILKFMIKDNFKLEKKIFFVKMRLPFEEIPVSDSFCPNGGIGRRAGFRYQ